MKSIDEKIEKYLVNEKMEITDDVEPMVYEEIDNIEFEVSKLVDRMKKKAVANIAKKTGMKRRDVNQLFNEIGETSDLSDWL